MTSFEGTARFSVVRKLGEGGMGAVYEVIDRDRDAHLALKTLRASEPDALLHLKHEFRVLQDLRHPNLVRLGELFEQAGQWFFTMELVDGVDLLSYVRPGAFTGADSGDSDTKLGFSEPKTPARIAKASPPPDERRLRDALAQLARALQALHDAGKIHRDIKPSNVLVSREGRVVLVDFGLALDVSFGAPSARSAGTAAFMAPEQASTGTLTAAADWYAFGVMLYALLTGTLPWRGAELMRRRANDAAPLVHSRAPEAPADLAALSEALLVLDPAARPTGRDVLARLGVASEFSPTSRFVGRAAELAALRDAFAESRTRATTSLVIGDSGLGKSMLARHLLAELRADHDCIVLSGRCYERESVPYKAFDGIVDALSELLSELPNADAILPDHAELLARVFPVLRRVPAIAALPPSESSTAFELRIRAFAALRALFATLAEQRPFILHIDDLHWADADSLDLIEALLDPATAPRLFLLATLRALSPDVAHPLARVANVRRLHLLPLPAADAHALAVTLLGDAALVDSVTQEAAGHPLFLIELAHHATRAGDLSRVKLDGALWSRVVELEPAARRLLEVLAIAGSPIEASVASRAAQLQPGTYADQVATLAIGRFARAHEGRVEPYHDRVREAVLANLSTDAQRVRNFEIAEALVQSGIVDTARLARHFADGGDRVRGFEYMVKAASAASTSLAFEESARLYERALALRECEDVALDLAAAEAFSAAGRGRQAADVWLSLAARGHDELVLRRRAAEELLSGGRLDEGYAVLGTLLADLGLSMPASPTAAVVRVAMGRVRSALAGRELRRRKPASTRELTRVDTVRGITLALWGMDPLMCAAVQTDHLRLALRAGDPARAAFAIGLEALWSSVNGYPAQARTHQLLEEARTLAGDSFDDEEMRVSLAVLLGGIALLEGRWKDASVELDTASRELSRTPLGHTAIRDLLRVLPLMPLFWRGRAKDLLERTAPLLRDAEERGNVNVWAWLQTLETWALALTGGASEAHERIALLRARLPASGLLLQRFYMEHSKVVVRLCEQRAEEAWHAMQRARQRTRFFMVGQAQRAWATWVYANAALGRALENPRRRASMLGEARRAALRLDAERTPWVDAAAACVRASVASIEGDDRRAMGLLDHAEPLLRTHHFESSLAALHVARGRYHLEARTWLSDQRLTPVSTWMMLPGTWSGAPSSS